MRIAMIAPLEMRVPPIGYGGTELVVSLLTEELVRKGHEVTLFATGDSVTKAELVSVCSSYLRGSNRNSEVLNMLNVLTCMERAGEFDIIHNHTTLEGVTMAGLVDTPALTTLHGAMNGDWRLLFLHYKGWYNTISSSAKSLLPPKDRFAGVIYNAIDVDTYPYREEKEDFLLFLSRMSVEKGPHLAIEVARRLGKRLILAGNVHYTDDEFFRTEIVPQVDGEQVRYVGEADYTMKRDLFCRAKALLAPLTWPEPFGLFMVEAMACGTPVLALNRGSAPEVVAHGRTGFVLDNVDEMVEAARRLDEIEPRACRRWVENRFNVPRMAEDYLSAYQLITAAERQRSLLEAKVAGAA